MSYKIISYLEYKFGKEYLLKQIATIKKKIDYVNSGVSYGKPDGVKQQELEYYRGVIRYYKRKLKKLENAPKYFAL